VAAVSGKGPVGRGRGAQETRQGKELLLSGAILATLGILGLTLKRIMPESVGWALTGAGAAGLFSGLVIKVLSRRAPEMSATTRAWANQSLQRQLTELKAILQDELEPGARSIGYQPDQISVTDQANPALVLRKIAVEMQSHRWAYPQAGNGHELLGHLREAAEVEKALLMMQLGVPLDLAASLEQQLEVIRAVPAQTEDVQRLAAIVENQRQARIALGSLGAPGVTPAFLSERSQASLRQLQPGPPSAPGGRRGMGIGLTLFAVLGPLLVGSLGLILKNYLPQQVLGSKAMLVAGSGLAAAGVTLALLRRPSWNPVNRAVLLSGQSTHVAQLRTRAPIQADQDLGEALARHCETLPPGPLAGFQPDWIYRMQAAVEAEKMGLMLVTGVELDLATSLEAQRTVAQAAGPSTQRLVALIDQQIRARNALISKGEEWADQAFLSPAFRRSLSV
jgi:hypothetical protein